VPVRRAILSVASFEETVGNVTRFKVGGTCGFKDMGSEVVPYRINVQLYSVPGIENNKPTFQY